ncbi:unnamed protein product, partial [Chrysoparadoxa australica]
MQQHLHLWKEQLHKKTSPELKLLLSFFDYERTAPLKRNSDFSFEKFLKLLGRHRIRPSILEKIDEFKVVFTSEELEQIKALSTPFLLRQMKLTQVAIIVISAFQESGIQVIPFKGQFLSKKLFDSYTFRETR